MSEDQPEKTTDAVKILLREYQGCPERMADLKREYLCAEIQQAIFDMRMERGLTQEGLAALAGVPAAVIKQIEDADYGLASLKTLKRIAGVLGKYVEVRYEDNENLGRVPRIRCVDGASESIVFYPVEEDDLEAMMAETAGK